METTNFIIFRYQIPELMLFFEVFVGEILGLQIQFIIWEKGDFSECRSCFNDLELTLIWWTLYIVLSQTGIYLIRKSPGHNG